MKFQFRVLAASSILLLFGCTQKLSDTSATAYQAIFGNSDIVLDKSSLEEIPYASSYFRINDGPQIFMVLALVDIDPRSGNKQLKWLSQDNAMIVTENGRIIKTLNLPDTNLVSFRSQLPLSNFDKDTTTSAFYDWQPNYQFNAQATITTSFTNTEYITSMLWSGTTDKWTETVTWDSETYQNIFWSAEGMVLKSKQWAIPGKLFIEQEVLRTYLEN